MHGNTWGRRRRDWIVSPRYPDLLGSNTEVDALDAVSKFARLIRVIMGFCYYIYFESHARTQLSGILTLTDARGLRPRTPLAAKSDEASVKFPLASAIDAAER